MPPFRHVFLPLVVTTATLWTCEFPAAKVDIATGVIPFSEVKYHQYPYLFFTYALPPILQFHTLGERARATAELEDRLGSLEGGVRDEIAGSFLLVEGLPVLLVAHPVVKGLCLLAGQHAHIV
jgi:hypothetical protein